MRSPKSHVFIGDLDRYAAAIQSGFEWTGVRVKSQDSVAIKPNLTFPVFRRGVMTNPECLESLIVYLKQFTNDITICESDSGGYNPFSMDEVFQRTGISGFVKKYGIRIVNMSHSSSREIYVCSGLKEIAVPLPVFLLDETDMFITMPVPKVHLNTIVSLGLKNQWGVIQQPAVRLKLHPYFKEVIYHVNKALPRTTVVVDGKYGLTRSGPLRGDVVELNWILISDDIFVGDYVVSEVMGFDWHQIPYLKYAFEREGLASIDEVEFNRDYKVLKRTQFRLERQWTDYPGLMTFNSRILAYIGYESVLARPLHWLLYRFREPFY